MPRSYQQTSVKQKIDVSTKLVAAIAVLCGIAVATAFGATSMNAVTRLKDKPMQLRFIPDAGVTSPLSVIPGEKDVTIMKSSVSHSKNNNTVKGLAYHIFFPKNQPIFGMNDIRFRLFDGQGNVLDTTNLTMPNLSKYKDVRFAMIIFDELDLNLSVGDKLELKADFGAEIEDTEFIVSFYPWNRTITEINDFRARFGEVRGPTNQITIQVASERVDAGSFLLSADSNELSTRIIFPDDELDLLKLSFMVAGEEGYIQEMNICVEDGGLNPNVTGSWEDITSISIYNLENMDPVVSDMPLSSPCTKIYIPGNGLLAKYDNTSLLLKAKMSNIGDFQPGESGADLKIGIKDVDGIKMIGSQSGMDMAMDYHSGMSAPYILFAGYPLIALESGDEELRPYATDLMEVSINNPTPNPITINRLTFVTGGSPGAEVVTAGLYKSNGQAIAHSVTGETAGNERYFEFNFNPIEISPGGYENISLRAQTISGVDFAFPDGEYIYAALLGDREFDSSSSLSGIDTNFIWSDEHTFNGGHFVDGMYYTTSTSFIVME